MSVSGSRRQPGCAGKTTYAVQPSILITMQP